MSASRESKKLAKGLPFQQLQSGFSSIGAAIPTTTTTINANMTAVNAALGTKLGNAPQATVDGLAMSYILM